MKTMRLKWLRRLFLHPLCGFGAGIVQEAIDLLEILPVAKSGVRHIFNSQTGELQHKVDLMMMLGCGTFKKGRKNGTIHSKDVIEEVEILLIDRPGTLSTDVKPISGSHFDGTFVWRFSLVPGSGSG